MDTIYLKECTEKLNVLKKDAQETQKKGLPFMLASVVIWVLIGFVHFMKKDIMAINMYTFCCSCFLMPLAYLFSKMLGIDIFKKTGNPINKLGFLCTLNQMLYLVIVMWAFNKSPQYMLMLYEVVFAAHMFPFGWVYDSRTYITMAVVETIGAVAIFSILGNHFSIGFMIVSQIIVCLCLAAEIRKARKKVED